MIDFTAFFRKTTLTFVKKVHESGDIYSFYFKADKPLKHTAGQHGLFVLPKLRGVHIFSLASAPTEEHIIVGTHVREESEYKQRLAALEPGDKMHLVGPVLDFVLPKEPQSVVFLAQGIGITPIRSMLIENDRQLDTTLIHVDSNDHTYKSVTEPLATQTFYVNTPEAFTEATVLTIAAKKNDAHYYISGSPRFVAATKETLVKNTIDPKNIKTDGFLGY